MSAVRRSHAAAGLALAALLLLLLARLPPAPAVPHPRRAALALPLPLSDGPAAPDAAPDAAPANRTTAPASSTTRRPTPSSSKAPESPDTAKAVPAVAAKTVPAEVPVAQVGGPGVGVGAGAEGRRGGPRVVLTRDMYVAGHAVPHPELCPALGARLQVAILVTSAPSHRRARDAIRMTWGHFALRSDVALAFVLGAPPEPLRAALQAEDALYGDMVIGRSFDSYSNLTLKTLSMLEWMDSYCPRAPRLLKTDDDMFINVPKLLEFATAPGRANATLTVWGKVVRKSLPKRTMRSKYYVPPIQFPGKVFPDFATGPAYLLTADAIRPLLEAAPRQPYLRLEDVFVTGVLAERVGVRRRAAQEFYNKKVAPHPCAVQRGVSIHMVQFHEQFDLWRKLLDGKTKCAS